MHSRIHRAVASKSFPKYQQYLLIFFIGLLFVFVSMSHQLFALKDVGMRVYFFDIGQGDGFFIETPHGKQLIIDGGPDQTILQKLPSVMWPWDHTIDAMFISHPDADHITGLVSVLERYDVKAIYETGVRGGTSVISELETRIDREHAKQVRVRQGDTFEFDGVLIDILWPTDQIVDEEKNRNNTSIVMRVRYGETDVLFTGDAEENVEDDFVASVGDIDVLKVGHHGSKTSTGFQMLSFIKPEIAIISDGEDNRYGHPHPVILSRLKQIGARIFRTDQDGDIELFSDGIITHVQPVFLPF